MDNNSFIIALVSQFITIIVVVVQYKVNRRDKLYNHVVNYQWEGYREFIDHYFSIVSKLTDISQQLFIQNVDQLNIPSIREELEIVNFSLSKLKMSHQKVDGLLNAEERESIKDIIDSLRVTHMNALLFVEYHEQVFERVNSDLVQKDTEVSANGIEDHLTFFRFEIQKELGTARSSFRQLLRQVKKSGTLHLDDSLSKIPEVLLAERLKL